MANNIVEARTIGREARRRSCSRGHSFDIIPAARQQTPADFQIPIVQAGGEWPFETRGFLPWRFSNAGPVSADSNGQ